MTQLRKEMSNRLNLVYKVIDIQLREIFNQCNHNFLTLNITIELNDGSTVKIQN